VNRKQASPDVSTLLYELNRGGCFQSCFQMAANTSSPLRRVVVAGSPIPKPAACFFYHRPQRKDEAKQEQVGRVTPCAPFMVNQTVKGSWIP